MESSPHTLALPLAGLDTSTREISLSFSLSLSPSPSVSLCPSLSLFLLCSWLALTFHCLYLHTYFSSLFWSGILFVAYNFSRGGGSRVAGGRLLTAFISAFSSSAPLSVTTFTMSFHPSLCLSLTMDLTPVCCVLDRCGVEGLGWVMSWLGLL